MSTGHEDKRAERLHTTTCPFGASEQISYRRRPIQVTRADSMHARITVSYMLRVPLRRAMTLRGFRQSHRKRQDER